MTELARGGARAAPISDHVSGVDCCAHVFRRGYRTVSHAPDYDAPIALYLGWLDRVGLSHGVLAQPAFYGFDNTCLIDALSRAPFRLRGVAALTPDTPEHDLWTLDALGVRGVRLNLFGRETPRFDAGPWPRFLRLLAGMGWHVEAQCRAADIERIAPPILRQGVDVVADLAGLPEAASLADGSFRALQRLGRTGRVWARLSAARSACGRRTVLPAHAPLREALGPSRLIWGSAWPHTRFEPPEVEPPGDLLAALFPDAGEREMVLAGNPAALFRFD